MGEIGLDCSPAEEESREFIPFIGLRNMGNTCYLNSVLQVLHHCPEFATKLTAMVKQMEDKLDSCHGNRDSVENEDKHKELLSNFEVLKELSSLLAMMADNRSIFLANCSTFTPDEMSEVTAIRPQSFVQSLRRIYPCFEPFTQQDAQELLHSLLNCFETTTSLANNQDKLRNNNKGCVESYKMVGGHKSAPTLVLRPSQNKDKRLSMNNKENNASLLSQQPGCFEKLKRKQIKKVDENKNSDPSDKENLKRDPNDLDNLSQPPLKRPRLISVEIKPNKPSFFKTFIGIKNKMSKKKFPVPCSKTEIVPTKIRFEDKLPKYCPPVENGVGEMFHGELVSSTRCTECEVQVEKKENFQDISLPVKEEREKEEGKTSSNLDNELLSNQQPTSGAGTDETTSLSWSISTHMKVQILDGDNKYFCNTCKRLSEGEQKIQFSLLPPVLTFHLKRFSASTSMLDGICSTVVKKILTKMSIPTTLKFNKWCDTKCCDKNVEYNLFGVVVHSGGSIGAGHYLSYVKYQHIGEDGPEMLKYNGRWVEMDDERTTLLCDVTINNILQGGTEVNSRSPYMLFYHKVEN